MQDPQSHGVADGGRDFCSEEMVADNPQPNPHGEHAGRLEEKQDRDCHPAVFNTEERVLFQHRRKRGGCAPGGPLRTGFEVSHPPPLLYYTLPSPSPHLPSTGQVR